MSCMLDRIRKKLNAIHASRYSDRKLTLHMTQDFHNQFIGPELEKLKPFLWNYPNVQPKQMLWGVPYRITEMKHTDWEFVWDDEL